MPAVGRIARIVVLAPSATLVLARRLTSGKCLVLSRLRSEEFLWETASSATQATHIQNYGANKSGQLLREQSLAFTKSKHWNAMAPHGICKGSVERYKDSILGYCNPHLRNAEAGVSNMAQVGVAVNHW